MYIWMAQPPPEDPYMTPHGSATRRNPYIYGISESLGRYASAVAPNARDFECEAVEDDPLTIPRIHLFNPSPSNAKPGDLFSNGTNRDSRGMLHSRFRSKFENGAILIFTDGSCLYNGYENAAAGCAFVFRPAGQTHFGDPTDGIVSFRLEDVGPDGHARLQTSNRAELRAVIAALQFRVWYGEGQKKVVIATDSRYVALGITCWVRTWSKNGWITDAGNPVLNRDLWEELLKELRHYQQRNTPVEFWRIPRAWNTVADEAAKKAAAQPSVPQYLKIYGAGC